MGKGGISLATMIGQLTRESVEGNSTQRIEKFRESKNGPRANASTLLARKLAHVTAVSVSRYAIHGKPSLFSGGTNIQNRLLS